jgi:SAM-dependent methyltransferase
MNVCHIYNAFHPQKIYRQGPSIIMKAPPPIPHRFQKRCLLIWILFFHLFFFNLHFHSLPSQIPPPFDINIHNNSFQCGGGHGTFLIDRCICDPGYGDDFCNTMIHPRSKLCHWNPHQPTCWNIPGIGRFRLPSLSERPPPPSQPPPQQQQQQQEAFACEINFWESTWIPKRNREQQIAFHFFRNIPKHIKNLLEVGAGPYTKTRLLLESQPDVEVNHVTLVDPLIQEYLRNPNITTSYPNGYLEVNNITIPTTILAQEGEQLSVPKMSFDLIVLVNTLEHCANAVTIMNLVYQALQPNGILIFGEGFATERELLYHDTCHPIQLTREFLLQYLGKFTGIPILPPQIGNSIQGIKHPGMKRSIFAIVRR